MSRLSRLWLVLAVLFTLGNVAFAFMPEVWRDPMHVRLHITLAVVGAFATWQLVRRRDGHRDGRQQGAAERPATPSALTGRLAQLEQSVDAVAIEIERIGEGQRFVTRVLTGRDIVSDRVQPQREGSAAPTAGDAMGTLHTTPHP